MIDPELLAPGEAVVAGVSGGPDSTALAHAAAQAGARVTVAHLDHGWRPGSAADAEAVAELSRRLRAPFRTERAEGLRRSEAAARAARYEFLARVAREVGAAKVAVAHTADDQAETVLMRLIRGAGLDGLAGMPRRRPLVPGVELVRPLLRVPRARVLAYCREHDLPWLEDETNRDRAWLRNRVRHELLPLLERRFNPRVREALLRTAALLADDAAALDGWTRREYRRDGGGLVLDGSLPVAVRRRLVRRFWAEETGLPPLPSRHVERLLAGPASLPRGWRGERRDGRLWLRAAASDRPAPFSYVLPVPGAVDVPEAGVRVTAEGEGGPLVVRSRRAGDRLRPWGGRGERKLQDVLVDAKVPRDERDRLAIVTAPDGTLLWVVGVVRAEALRGGGLRLDAAPFRATIG
jgi:tRNA(Ile)-lysidine synthase